MFGTIEANSEEGMCSKTNEQHGLQHLLNLFARDGLCRHLSRVAEAQDSPQEMMRAWPYLDSVEAINNEVAILQAQVADLRQVRSEFSSLRMQFVKHVRLISRHRQRTKRWRQQTMRRVWNLEENVEIICTNIGIEPRSVSFQIREFELCM